ncbi:hypothetical protein AYO45_05390 [Gammaproteobacteria bacterium SCGC AG-212-F23]|nr:hypothetical protein AYO45_05390 [Gammaproteobacteria bacterium SCGC AG-212-F23]
MKIFPKIAFISCVIALIVIGLGAFTRLIDAGLGCPDWPGCYGHLAVPHTYLAQKLVALEYPTTPLVIYKAWAEMVHRYAVAGLSLFIFSIIIMIISVKKLRTRANIIFSLLLLALLGYQIILGQWTVTLKLQPIIVTQHLIGGYLILTTLWLIFLVNRAKFGWNPDKKLLPWALGGLILVFLQIILGAWTSTHYASLSCPDFPFCVNNQTMPVWHIKDLLTVKTIMHMAHRVGAMVVTIYLFCFAMIAIVRLRLKPSVNKLFILILFLLIMQIGLGMSNVLFKLPLAIAISHTVTAVLLFLALATLNFNLLFKKVTHGS